MLVALERGVTVFTLSILVFSFYAHTIFQRGVFFAQVSSWKDSGPFHQALCLYCRFFFPWYDHLNLATKRSHTSEKGGDRVSAGVLIEIFRNKVQASANV
jgi:hypothetical protein